MYHVLSRNVRALITPLLQLALGILIKRGLGLNKETSLYSNPPQIALLRRYINSYTLSKSVLMTAFSILGTHYEGVSVRRNTIIPDYGLKDKPRWSIAQWAPRLDAGFVHHRSSSSWSYIIPQIYWPNSGFFCLDPELLEIGNDVVFGSRSEVLTTDCLGTAKIVVGDGGRLSASRSFVLTPQQYI
jgi:hypothetical protein